MLYSTPVRLLATRTQTSRLATVSTTLMSLQQQRRRTLAKKSDPPLSPEPLPTPPTMYPPAANPFDPDQELVKANQAKASGAADGQESNSPKVSPLKASVVKAVAKLMGYNSKSVTAIRETGNMCGELVDAVRRDHDFWYNECALPPTYQTFFQLHLLYLVILVPRLRCLPTSSLSTSYQTELLTHFFALAENQMRLTLGQGEQERTVKNFMGEMGQQWKGASLSFDSCLALGRNLPETGGDVFRAQYEDRTGAAEVLGVHPDQLVGADTELAAWVWRNLFSARYSDLPAEYTPAPPAASADDNKTNNSTDPWSPMQNLALPVQLNLIVKFIRREMARLDKLTDEDVEQGRIGKFGSVRSS